MAYPPTLASLNLAANFRGKMLKALALLLSSFESEQDARVAGQAVYMSSGPGAPTANIGTNVRGVYFREDASDTDAFIYLTVNGSTWVAIETLADLDHLIPGASTEKTISGGVITVTGLLHTVDTEADAASDDLDTISGLADGELCLLYLENAARNVVVKHGTGNISGPRGQDVTLDAAGDMVLVERKGSVVYVVAYHLAAGQPTSASGTGATGAPSASDTAAAAETINDHAAAPCTGAAVADHGAITPAGSVDAAAPGATDSATTGITSSQAAHDHGGSTGNAAGAGTGSTAASITLGGSTAADGTGVTSPPSPDDTAAATPTFTGSASTTATTPHVTGTGFATVGQVVTTTDNQTLALNECAGMWLITATQAPCLIDSHPACVGAPAVFTVFGLAPLTAAEAYRVLRVPTPAGSVSSHTHAPGNHSHTGPSHTHGSLGLTATDAGHTHTESSHNHGVSSATPAVSITDGGHSHAHAGTHQHAMTGVTVTPPAHVVTQPSTPVLAHAGMGHQHGPGLHTHTGPSHSHNA
jgi:hypothetical protein